MSSHCSKLWNRATSKKVWGRDPVCCRATGGRRSSERIMRSHSRCTGCPEGTSLEQWGRVCLGRTRSRLSLDERHQTCSLRPRRLKASLSSKVIIWIQRKQSSARLLCITTSEFQTRAKCCSESEKFETRRAFPLTSTSTKTVVCSFEKLIEKSNASHTSFQT